MFRVFSASVSVSFSKVYRILGAVYTLTVYLVDCLLVSTREKQRERDLKGKQNDEIVCPM